MDVRIVEDAEDYITISVVHIGISALTAYRGKPFGNDESDFRRLRCECKTA